MTATSDAARRPWFATPLAWITTGALVGALTHTAVLLAPLHSDVNAWLYIAGRMAHGEVPYRDHFENKLPLIYEVLRPILATGNPRVGLYVADLIRCGITGWAAGILVFPIMGARVALAAAGLAVAVLGIPIFYGSTTTESFASPLLAAGIAVGVSAARSGRSPLFGLAAFLVALGAGFRSPAALCGVALLVPVVALWRRDGKRSAVAAMLWGALGGGLGALVVVLPPLVGGYFREFSEVSFGWGAKYAAETSAFAKSGLSDGSILSGWQVSKLWPVYAFAAVGAFGAARGGRHRAERLCVALWAGAGLAQARLGGHLYHHHFIPALVPLAVLAVFGAGDIVTWLGRWKRTAGAAGAVGAAVAFLSMLWPTTQPWTQAWGRFDQATRARGVAETVEYLDGVAAPDEPVLIWTWGWQAELWWRLDRPAPPRHFLAVIYPGGGALDR